MNEAGLVRWRAQDEEAGSTRLKTTGTWRIYSTGERGRRVPQLNSEVSLISSLYDYGLWSAAL